MSGTYIYRLRAIQFELAAAREALSFVERHWQSHGIYREIDLLRPRDFAQASRHIEETYLIRLYAEFEGVLKDHLTVNRPHIQLPDRPRVDWLLSRVEQTENISVELPLRQRMNLVRDYRNSIAHQDQRRVLYVAFDDALSILNTFLARLPDPNA